MKFQQAPVPVSMQYRYGNEGMVMKELVPAGESKLYIIPWGALDEDQYYDSAGVFTGDVTSGYCTSTIWLNTEDINPAAKEALGVADKMKSKTVTFLAPAKTTGKEWYRPLGYVDSTAEANEAIANNIVTEASWKRVYPSGTLYPTNLVMNQPWFSFPLVEVEITGTGKNRAFALKEAVWARLNKSQYDAFVNAFSGISMGDNPQVKHRVVKLANSGQGTSRYSFTLVETSIPEELHEQIDDVAEHVEDYAQRTIGNIFTQRHNSLLFGSGDDEQEEAANKAVLNYLVGITTFKNANDFVSAYSVLANPLGEDDFEDVEDGEFAL